MEREREKYYKKRKREKKRPLKPIFFIDVNH